MIWKPDASAPLWHLPKGENHMSYFDDLKLEHLRQIGPSCVRVLGGDGHRPNVAFIGCGVWQGI